jgi:glycosyltransferase involved in cell wall biosynthesis
MSRVCVALGGTDRGRSGLGTYVRAMLPRLADRLGRRAGTLVALGTRADLEPYDDCLRETERRLLPEAVVAPGPNAIFHLLWAGREARRCGADVLLLPAANRRLTAVSDVKTVAVVHDLAQLNITGKYDALRMAYSRQVVIGALRTQSRLVAVSQATRHDLAGALRLPGQAIEVIPNGVETSRYSPSAGEAGEAQAAACATGLDGRYLLYVSRLEHPGKNHIRLLRAFALSGLRGSHTLALAGQDWGAEPAIRAEAARLGLGRSLRLLGRVSDEFLPGLVAGADATVMVGLQEGFGLPALEALACGRPVLASRAGALPEVVGELGALCDPYDEHDMARGLVQITNDAALRARAASEGPAWARRHSWDAAADALLDVCIGRAA